MKHKKLYIDEFGTKYILTKPSHHQSASLCGCDSLWFLQTFRVTTPETHTWKGWFHDQEEGSGTFQSKCPRPLVSIPGLACELFSALVYRMAFQESELTPRRELAEAAISVSGALAWSSQGGQLEGKKIIKWERTRRSRNPQLQDGACEKRLKLSSLLTAPVLDGVPHGSWGVHGTEVRDWRRIPGRVDQQHAWLAWRCSRG